MTLPAGLRAKLRSTSTLGIDPVVLDVEGTEPEEVMLDSLGKVFADRHAVEIVVAGKTEGVLEREDFVVEAHEMAKAAPGLGEGAGMGLPGLETYALRTFVCPQCGKLRLVTYVNPQRPLRCPDHPDRSLTEVPSK